jgi:MHS family proline/betaine transporter-like MFS transporter
MLGNILEWYEFAIYGYLEEALKEQFFQGSRIATWLGFAVTFVARPLGATIFGAVGDRFGRKVSVNYSILGMLLGTVGQGLLPTYANGRVLGGVGLFLLTVLRLIQGLCTGGEISAISVYLAEVSPPEMLGRTTSLIAVTLGVGFLSALGAVLLLTRIMGEDSMMDWGWRLPFVFALIPGVVAIWGRRNLHETPAFLESCDKSKLEDAEAPEGVAQADVCTDREKSGASVCDFFRANSAGILIGIGAVVSASFMQYIGFVWTTSYLKSRGMPAEQAELAGVASNVVRIIFTLPMGWFADVQGVGAATAVGAAILALCGLPLFTVLHLQPTNMTAVLLSYGLGYGFVGAMSYTTTFLFVVELFPTHVRNVGVGMAYNIGFAIFGGFGPAMAEASLMTSPLGPGILMSASGLVTVGTIIVGLFLQRRGKVQMAHVRVEPYFRTCRSRASEVGGRLQQPSSAHELPTQHAQATEVTQSC